MIKVVQTDITCMKVQVIVNAANNSLLGGGGVDGAIHKAAGPELLKFNRHINGCDTGQAKISPGFNLPANWIIHTVGPVWRDGEQGEAELLANCYRNTFKLAAQKGLKTIAFPSISTGAYGYPKEKAAKVAISIMQDFNDKMDEIIVCCFSTEDLSIYKDLLIEN